MPTVSKWPCLWHAKQNYANKLTRTIYERGFTQGDTDFLLRHEWHRRLYQTLTGVLARQLGRDRCRAIEVIFHTQYIILEISVNYWQRFLPRSQQSFLSYLYDTKSSIIQECLPTERHINSVVVCTSSKYSAQESAGIVLAENENSPRKHSSYIRLTRLDRRFSFL